MIIINKLTCHDSTAWEKQQQQQRSPNIISLLGLLLLLSSASTSKTTVRVAAEVSDTTRSEQNRRHITFASSFVIAVGAACRCLYITQTLDHSV